MNVATQQLLKRLQEDVAELQKLRESLAYAQGEIVTLKLRCDALEAEVPKPDVRQVLSLRKA